MHRFQEDSFDPRLRIAILGLTIIGIVLVLLSRVIVLAGFSGEYYRQLSLGNQLREKIIPANRGIIFDRNGTNLVSNLPVFIKKQCDDSGKCTQETVSKDEAISDSSVETVATRQYPYGPVLAHAVGYVAIADKKGEAGVEAKYDQALSGKSGKELIEVDATGRQLRSLGQIDPVAGEDLALAIDLPLQKSLYEALKDYSGAAVATDPRTGAVLALVSVPSFDPNLLSEYGQDTDAREQALKKLFSDSSEPLFNRAIAGGFPPGSNFKLVTAMAGLESGAITSSTTVEDTGIITIGPYKFANWKWLQDGGTQGVLDVVGALKHSNDIFFYRVGEWTGIDKLTGMAEKFGLGGKLGIDLPGEGTGLVPDSRWRMENTRTWYLGDTYHLAIGQGDLLVTPLQDNAWTSVIANGGRLCTPHMLLNTPADCRSLGFKKDNIDLVRTGMIEACSPGGTAYPLFNFKDPKNPGKEIQIACKTGTAEYNNPGEKTHAWLTAYAPADNPTIAVTVLIEGGGEGADIASPVVKKALDTWFSSH